VIAAVVVTFSATAEMLDRCLRALRDQGGLDQIVVVDTGARAEVAADLHGDVRLIRMENRGYGAAANRGFADLPDATAIALLNDDVVVGPGWLQPLLDALAPLDVGAAQPALVGADPSVVTSLGVEIDRYGAGSDIGDGGPLPSDRAVCDLEIFNGGTVLFDAAFVRSVGGFDERYFLYYEDVDLALRGHAAGWRYLLVPESVVEHRRGTSTAQDAERTLLLQERNRLWAAFRWAPPATVGRALWLSVRRLRHPPRTVHRKALVAGLVGGPRRLSERVRR
jgi:GT2 family glycosyltransferase